MDKELLIQIANSFKEKIEEYFNRLSVLTTQIPHEIRLLLLPKYMTWSKFQSDIYVDPYGNFGFYIHRESEGVLPTKIKQIRDHVEKEIFGFYTESNIVKSEFVFDLKFYRVEFDCNELRGVITLSYSDARFVECDIIGILREKRFVKRVHFAWILQWSIVKFVNASLYAEEDFYSMVLNEIKKIISYEYPFRKDSVNIKIAVRYFVGLLEKIEADVCFSVTQTEVDEQVFQKLLERYKFFLCPSAKRITSQRTLSGDNATRRPDFTIELDEATEIHVEIEPPFYKPFEGGDISNRLQLALKQISDWKKINSTKSANNKKTITYIIIIGINSDLTPEEQHDMELFNENQVDIKVKTWDWIVNNISNLKEAVKKQIVT